MVSHWWHPRPQASSWAEAPGHRGAEGPRVPASGKTSTSFKIFSVQDLKRRLVKDLIAHGMWGKFKTTTGMQMKAR